MNFFVPDSIKNKEKLSVKFEIVNRKEKKEVVHYGLKAVKEVHRSVYIMIENDYNEPSKEIDEGEMAKKVIEEKLDE